jgi:CHAD domain-containing protein
LLGAVALASVGVGLAVALGEVDRRVVRKRAKRARKLGLVRGEETVAGLRRMALGQLEHAIELLETARREHFELTTHETRKAIKRVRALIRVCRDELGEHAYRRHNVALREAGRHLSAARDAQVALDTFEHVVSELPAKRAQTRSVMAMRTLLHAQRDLAVTEALADEGSHVAALSQLREVRRGLACSLQGERPREHARGGRLAPVRPGVERIYTRGRRRLKEAGKGKDPARLHELRKRVKDLRYAAEMLRIEGSSKRLAKLASAADVVGESLGDEHDLVVLSERVRANARLFASDPRTARALRKVIKRSRRRLRKRALGSAKQLYASKRVGL